MKDGGAQGISYCAEEIDELMRGPDQEVVCLAWWVPWPDRAGLSFPGPGKEKAILGNGGSVQTGLEGNQVNKSISFAVTDGSNKAHCLSEWCLLGFLFH